MKLVIVESPSKAKTIQKYLGSEYKVMASVGHIYDLPKKSLGIDIDNNFEPQYVVVDANKKKIISELKSAVSQSKTVYLATDPDREGEAISWHIANSLGINGQKNRIEFNEITRNSIANAIENPRFINISLVDAQQARRVIDRLVGYKVSPVLSSKIKSGLSGGRVQSAALKMIVDREREVQAFTPIEYWNLVASLKNKDERDFKALAVELNGKKIKISNEEEAKQMVKALERAIWDVESIKKSKVSIRPYAPFTTSTLQQDASIKLGLSSPVVMQIAQQLYEGIDIEGQGHLSLITYIRTDSVRISNDIQNIALNYINDKYGKEFVPKKPNFYMTKKNAQDAHEAIRPVDLALTPESLKGLIKSNQYKLYKLIYERFLASQMTPAVYDSTNIGILASVDDSRFLFKLQGRTLIEKGFTIVYETQTNENDEEIQVEKELPTLTTGMKLKFNSIESIQKFTKPPSRFTEASLIKAMEENGIGRPSTYASVISVLSRREYVKREKRILVPTILGIKVTEYMESYFPDIVDLQFTANMEDSLDTVEAGEDWKLIISQFYPKFSKDVENAKKNSEKVKLPVEVSEIACDKCGAMMVVKDGRYGKFLACPNYPRCKNIKSINERVGACPVCGSDVVKRKTKMGKTYYACENKNCKFMSWDIPAPMLCPDCDNAMTIRKTDGKERYRCTNKTCNKVIIVAEKSEV